MFEEFDYWAVYLYCADSYFGVVVVEFVVVADVVVVELSAIADIVERLGLSVEPKR